MKKTLILLAFVLLVLTGCGNKQLTCTYEDGEEKETIIYTFNDDDLVIRSKRTNVSTFDEVISKEEQETLKAYGDALCSSLYTSGAYECVVEVSEKELKLSVTTNYENLTDAEKETLDYSEDTATFKAIKEDAESNGYSCK